MTKPASKAEVVVAMMGAVLKVRAIAGRKGDLPPLDIDTATEALTAARSLGCLMPEEAAALRDEVDEARGDKNYYQGLYRSALTERDTLAARLKAAEDALAALPTSCDGKEQYAFEAWAKTNRYEMHEHPLHYLFMDPKTNAARNGWRAALNYGAGIRAALTPPPSQEESK